MTSDLTAVQSEHIAKVFPECRAEMSRYLRDGAMVDVRRQDEVREAPAFAIYVCSAPEFWIDCCDTEDQARTMALSLGLKLQ
jgi:hypothetical protein